jgi:hypothetical protein
LLQVSESLTDSLFEFLSHGRRQQAITKGADCGSAVVPNVRVKVRDDDSAAHRVRRFEVFINISFDTFTEALPFVAFKDHGVYVENHEVFGSLLERCQLHLRLSRVESASWFS